MEGALPPGPVYYVDNKGRIKKTHHGLNLLRKTHVRILGVQPEFYHKGGGGGLNRLAKWVVAVL